MTPSGILRNRHVKRVACEVAVLCVICLVVLPASCQEITTLLEFTNVWKYYQSGLELGTDWRTDAYDDAFWPSGPGLLGFEDTPYVYTSSHAPISTPLTISSTVTSYYFRTTFQFTGETN